MKVPLFPLPDLKVKPDGGKGKEGGGGVKKINMCVRESERKRKEKREREIEIEGKKVLTTACLLAWRAKYCIACLAS